MWQLKTEKCNFYDNIEKIDAELVHIAVELFNKAVVGKIFLSENNPFFLSLNHSVVAKKEPCNAAGVSAGNLLHWALFVFSMELFGSER